MRKLSVNTGGMSRPGKQSTQPKKVLPPSVPDVYRHSCANFTENETTDQMLNDPTMLQGPFSPMLSLNFTNRGEPLTHKAAVYYHQQLALQEDQGIDMQSLQPDVPSSPSSSSGSRHSTASLDSGKASSYLTGTSASLNCVQLNSPRCSVSSCSIGSVDRMSNNSNRNDHDLIYEWLLELNCEEYTNLFTNAGYDMPTITRMTPEDLTAIGIKNPHHRERIKQHIDALQLPDTLPGYVPGSIEEWLKLLRLEEYTQQLFQQGYQTVRDVTQVTWEDLEDIGIVKLGHQKKILLAIKRVKDIIGGKFGPYLPHSPQLKLAQHELFDPSGMASPLSCNRVPIKADPYFGYIQSKQIYQNIPEMNIRRSFDDGDITPTNDMICEHMKIQGETRFNNLVGQHTLPRQHQHNRSYNSGMLLNNITNRQRPVAKVTANNISITPQLNQIETVKPEMMEMKKIPPQPPQRYNTQPSTADQTYGQYQFYGQQKLQPNPYSNYVGQKYQTTAEVHYQKESIITSSLDSIDQIPFANENAGTIKQRTMTSTRSENVTISTSSSSSSSTSSQLNNTASNTAATSPTTNAPVIDNDNKSVLNDIGNMLANLTDELDAMLEEEKRIMAE